MTIMTSDQAMQSDDRASQSGVVSRFNRPTPLGTDIISNRRANVIRWFARAWSIAAVALFVLLYLLYGTPFVEDAGDWQVPVQLTLLAVVALGAALAWRWEIIGASIILIGAAGLGILAALSFDPGIAFLPFVVFMVPAVLHWLVWQRRHSLFNIVLLGGLLTILLAGGAYGAERVHQHYFGPSHPLSTTTQPRTEDVEWAWSGGVTVSEAVVKARLTSNIENANVVLSTSPEFNDSDVIRFSGHIDPRTGIATFQLDGLSPNTMYHYAIEADGRLDEARRGTFQTFPSGAASFTFAYGHCAATGSNGRVFDTIRESDPLFMLYGGDFFYENIAENDPELFRAAYERVFDAAAQSTLFRSTSIGYVWDDHDYGPNDSDRTSPARDAAQQVYREYVPHYPLAADRDGAIYQTFTVGRARFIVTDLRSHRDPASDPDGPQKSMMGAEQKNWFKQQLLEADEQYPVIIWVSTVPWIADETPGADHWGGYATERREIANFIAENQIDGLFMLSGDAHMIAIDDGTNSDYSDAGNAAFPVFHAGALDRYPSEKGGPFSEGAYPGGGHFGLVTVDDDGGDEITITFEGRDWTDHEIASYEFSVDADD